MRKLSNVYSDNVAQLDRLLRVEENFDVIKKPLRIGADEVTLYYIDGFVKDEIMQKLISQNVHTEQDQMIRDAKQFILEHIQETIYVEAIANQVHLNEQYLMRLFKKETGMTILEYITNERVTMAAELLVETNFPIVTVADSVGYGNYSYFTKIFKRYMGDNPKTYRQKHKTAE